MQTCAGELLKLAGETEEGVDYKIAGINHMAWLLELKRNGEDIYPAVREKVLALTDPHDDMVRVELMRRFGYYVTESSEHSSEYNAFFIKRTHPELIDRFRIPLDEYPRRCEKQIADWEKQRQELVHNPTLTHERSIEYGSYIIEAMESGKTLPVRRQCEKRRIYPKSAERSMRGSSVLCGYDRNQSHGGGEFALSAGGAEPDEYQRSAHDDRSGRDPEKGSDLSGGAAGSAYGIGADHR